MLKIEKVRGTYYEITLDGASLTGETFTQAQAEAKLDLYQKIFQSGVIAGYNECLDDNKIENYSYDGVEGR